MPLVFNLSPTVLLKILRKVLPYSSNEKLISKIKSSPSKNPKYLSNTDYRSSKINFEFSPLIWIRGKDSKKKTAIATNYNGLDATNDKKVNEYVNTLTTSL